MSVAVLGTGCNAFGDDVAGTVNGIDISWAQVNSLAKTATDPAKVTSGVADASIARRAMQSLVILGVYQSELKHRGIELTEAERSAARDAVVADAQKNQFYESLDDTGKSVEIDLEASQTKVQTAIAGLDATSQDVQRELIARLPGLADVKCADVLDVTATVDANAVEAKLKAGVEPAVIVAADAQNMQTQHVCLNAVARRSIQVDTAFFDAPAGTITRHDISSQGATGAVEFFRSNGAFTLKPGDADLVDVIKRMQYIATDQQTQAKSQAWIQYAVASAKVVVDPRLGSWSADDVQVVAPTLPLDRSPTTTVPAQALTQPTPTQPAQGA